MNFKIEVASLYESIVGNIVQRSREKKEERERLPSVIPGVPAKKAFAP